MSLSASFPWPPPPAPVLSSTSSSDDSDSDASDASDASDSDASDASLDYSSDSSGMLDIQRSSKHSKHGKSNSSSSKRYKRSSEVVYTNGDTSEDEEGISGGGADVDADADKGISFSVTRSSRRSSGRSRGRGRGSTPISSVRDPTVRAEVFLNRALPQRGITTDHSVLIVGRDDCPYCQKLYNLLDSMGVTYTKYSVSSKDETAIQLLIERTKQKTVPMVWINGEFRGGFQQVVEEYATRIDHSLKDGH